MAAALIDHNTYNVYFAGNTIRTTVTYDPAEVSWWISQVESRHGRRLLVGLDVEWRPSYQRGVQNPPATLQLCVGSRCLIYQLIHTPHIPYALTDFLSNPDNKFVGVAIKADIEKLHANHAQFVFTADPVDLREVAANAYGNADLRNSGLKRLASLVLGKEVEKPQRVTMSPWDNWRLTPDQVHYACVDAFVCSEIGLALSDFL